MPEGRVKNRPHAFSGTIFVQKMHNFEIDAGIQLAPNKATPTRAVLGTGSGPSVMRWNCVPPGWSTHASRTLRSSHVCFASGQLLKARGIASLPPISEIQRMFHVCMVFTALSVPLILRIDFQGTHKQGIFARTTTVASTNRSLSHAVNS